MDNQTVFKLQTTINGQPVRRELPAQTLLLDFLREDLGLTGTKRSCEIQICGSCTVLLDGLPVSACSLLAYETHGREVLTIEGVGENGELHPVQSAFLQTYGLQCGFCTPGMVLTTLALLAENPNPEEETIRAYLDSNLCRCTGYYPILDAVKTAIDLLSEASGA
jgi:carbon-monoxide dehydrogenase small subunit